MKMFLFLFILIFNNVSYSLKKNQPEMASAILEHPLVKAQRMMVVTNNSYATKTAYKILQQGGNAVDAAIGASFVLGLTEPQSSGIGGGGYAISYVNKSLLAYDGRETAPNSAKPNMFSQMDFAKAVLSAHSVGVPSQVKLLFTIHQKQGKLRWNKLLKPAIDLAINGFIMSERLHALLEAETSMPKIYFRDGKLKAIGQKIVNKEYAKTLKIIAKNPMDFYSGRIANDIIAKVNETEKILTKTDFLSYKVEIYPAICSLYRDKYKICSVPPSSAGGITTQELVNIYAKSYFSDNYNDNRWIYYFLEASKLAFADRNKYIADSKFVKNKIDGLLNEDYIATRAKLITDIPLKTPVLAGELNKNRYAIDNNPHEHGTTSIVVIDKDNNAISLTLSIEHQFGSHIFVDGFFLNNELTDFSFESTDNHGNIVANQVYKGKRPRSSMTPTIVFDAEKLHLVTGSAGGSNIICYVAKTLIQTLDMHLLPNIVLSHGNLCALNSPAEIELNSDLTSRTKNIKNTSLVSGSTIILKHNNYWYGAADPRREGIALGN